MTGKQDHARQGATAPARRAPLGGGWVLLTALFCLFGQVASFAHLALVRHATCREHDALVHAPDSPPGLAAGAATPRPGQSGTVPASLAPLLPEVGHDDDHCLVSDLRRRELLPALQGQSGLTQEPPAPLALTTRAEVFPRSVPLLRLAPKSSPPALVS